MKTSIGKNTQAYLNSLESQDQGQADFYYRQPDAFDKLIYVEGLRMQRVYLEKDLNLILVLLNSKKVIKRALSDFPRLAAASIEALHHFETDGIGIHWPDLDEDLSLKGFLAYELAHADLRIAY